MTRTRLALASTLLASATLAGCFRDADDVDRTGTIPASSEAAAVSGADPWPDADDAVEAPATAATGAAGAAAPVATARPLNVTAVDLGSAVGADDRVTTAATAFGRNDTIYVSVATDGSGGNVPVTAAWTAADGQVVASETRTVANAGPAVTAFRVSRPEGWPAGTYQVRISVGDEVVETREFAVR